jgi:hypothetical protein
MFMDGVDDGARHGVAAVVGGARRRVIVSRGGWGVERIEIHGEKGRAAEELRIDGIHEEEPPVEDTMKEWRIGAN